MNSPEAGESAADKLKKKVIKFSRSRIFWTKAFVVAVFAVLAVSRSGWEDRDVIFGATLFLAGLALVAACLSGRAWSLSHIAGSKDSKLIMTGPYSLSRNPLYVANFLGAVGLGLCTRTITMTVFIIIGFALYYPGVIAGEEARLKEIFGDEFEEYRQKVPRFFPSFRNYAEEETMTISLRSLRRGLFEMGAIVIAVGLIELVGALHKAQVLPNLFTLY